MSDTQIMILKSSALYDHYKLLIDKLNKGCHKGMYDIEEAYNIKVACDNMLAAIDTLDKLQTLYIKMSQNTTDDEE